MVCYCLYVLAGATCVIFPHRSLAFRNSTAQKTNGEYIVRAFDLTPTASPPLEVCDPEGSGPKQAVLWYVIYDVLKLKLT